MHTLDDVQLYDLSEAGRLLHRDPVRLARQARQRRIPSASIPHTDAPYGLGLPVPWVDAAAGSRPEDPDALCVTWLARLAPPSPDAHRAARPCADLPPDEFVTPDTAARRLCASPKALQRMDEDGVLPSLRVDGSRQYDAQLVELFARRADGDDVTPDEIEVRRAQVHAWARFEYRAAAQKPEPPPSRLIRAEGFETVDDDD